MRSKQASPYARVLDTPDIVRLLLMITISACSVIGVIFWVTKGWQETTLSLLLMAGASGLLLVLQQRGFTDLSAFLLYLVASSVITFNVSIGHGIYDEAMLVYPLLIVFSGLIFGKRSAVLVTGISLGQIVLIYLLAQSGQVQPFEGIVQIELEETITTCIILMATGFLVWLLIDIMENAVEQILQSESDLEDAYNQTLIAWAKALELRNREDPGHSARVTSLARLFAEQAGLSPEEVKAVWQGALLHDIGKMGIPESILHKPEQLTEQEIALMQSHTEWGKNLIGENDYLAEARQIVAWHHERYDGSGYPDHLQGEEIPYAVGLFSLVDCWDSLHVERPCRPAWTDEQSLSFIKSQAGKKFHPEIAAQFLDLIDKFGLEEEG